MIPHAYTPAEERTLLALLDDATNAEAVCSLDELEAYAAQHPVAPRPAAAYTTRTPAPATDPGDPR